MKIAAGRVAAFAKRPDPKVSVALVYGPDAGAVRETSAALLGAVLDDPNDAFRRADLAGPEIARDPARLVDEFCALSMIGGRRVIRLTDAGDGVTKALEMVLDSPGEALVVAEAGDLAPRSSLRKLCEKAGHAAALPCYVADAATVMALAAELVAEAGKTLDRDAAARLGDLLPGDRMLARREIEKLILFAGDASSLTAEHVGAVVGDGIDPALDTLTDAVLDGRAAVADATLDRLFAAGTSAVGLLRAVQRQLLRLHEAGTHCRDGLDVDAAMARLRPPVFFRQQTAFRGQLNRWPPAAATGALIRLAEAEALVKRTGIPPETVCRQTLLDLTERLRRVR